MRDDDLRESNDIEGRRGIPVGVGQPTQQVAPDAPRNTTGMFVAHILDETEHVCHQERPRQANKPYRAPTLVLFPGQTASSQGTVAGPNIFL